MRKVKWKKEILVRGREVVLTTISRAGLLECFAKEGSTRAVRIAADSAVGYWSDEKQYYVPTPEGWAVVETL